MELRHLRYFVAVAEEGSFVTAAERRLHTSQPSLSRQIRDLEDEVGARLFERKARGVEVTEAGRVFLDHARLALAQVEAAVEGARRADRPPRRSFAIGFLAGQEVIWLPHALRILREEAPDVAITLFSQSSPELALALMRGKLDIAFVRHEKETTGIEFRFLAREPLIAVLPADHRLTAKRTIRAEELAQETYISAARSAPVLKAVVESYAAQAGIALNATYEAENLSGAMSLVASTGGIALIPFYAQNMLTPNVVARAIDGEPPMIDLELGYNTANSSDLLQRFLGRVDELVECVRKQSIVRYAEAR